MPLNTNKTYNILLADDDWDDRFFFGKALKQLGIAYHFHSVIDGDQLMTYLTSRPEPFPDVLFLDINMPCKNGVECLTEIKRNKALKGIPVVICSTSLLIDAADLLYKTGAHYYMHKCDFDKLPGCIKTIIDLLAKNQLQPPRDEFMINV
ncbi:MAG: response regulator [Bacteroidota bacterium]|nr:response regulator [Bacteroidota bacterium]